MPTGSCFCGKVKYSYTGEPQGKALCHCADCRKISGGAYSINVIVPEDGFKLESGTPKSISKTADSDTTITSFFCGDCGSTMWRETKTFGTNKIIKAGTLDDQNALNEAKPALELFSPNRVDWVPAVPGTEQKETMK